MKLLYSLILSLAFAGLANAQKTEVAFQLNTSATKFGGSSAEERTFISVSDTGPENYLGETYGSKAGIGYGVGLQLQRVTKSMLLFGFQVSAEQLRSKIEIDRVIGFWINADAEGNATLKLNSLNVQPYLGWRLANNFAAIDLTVGTDAGFITKSKFEGKATDENGNTFEVSGENSEQELDIRARFGVTAYKGHFGVGVSYAHGLTNYRSDWDGGDGELYSRVFRLGVLYRL